jgi:hypothetical protein
LEISCHCHVRWLGVNEAMVVVFPTPCEVASVKFGSIDSHSPMRGHMGHPTASQGDLENQLVL